MSAGPGFQPDPYRLFAAFPARHIAPQHVVAPVARPAGLTALFKHRMNMSTPDLPLDPDALGALVQAIHARSGQTVSDLASACDEATQARVFRTLAWLAKLGYLRLGPPGST